MKIGIFGSKHQSEKQSVIRRVFTRLHELSFEIYVEAGFASFLKTAFDFEPQVAGLINKEEADLDLVISMGGDGTFLRTAAWVNRQNIPIVGINTGRLGFLADVGNEDIEETIEELADQKFRIEERTLLKLETEGNPYHQYNYALNEIAVLKRDTSSMITIRTALNNEFLTDYQADGLIIATPTGSTAYSMSVNGPIIFPQDNSLVLSPVAPHSLNVRPLVIPDDFVINLEVESRNRTFLISLDGRSEIFPAGTVLKISKADFTTKVIKRYNHTFYETLRQKLMWGADVRIKR